VLVWLFLTFLLLLSLGLTISSTLHLGMLAAHLSVTHLLVAHLIHRVLLARITSGLSHFAGVHHLRLVSAHVFPVALMLVLHLVFVPCHFSGSAFTCSRALAIMFSHISAVVLTFSGSGFRTFLLKITFSYVPRFVSTFSSSCSLTLALG
jgi:hypothetical protein